MLHAKRPIVSLVCSIAVISIHLATSFRTANTNVPNHKDIFSLLKLKMFKIGNYWHSMIILSKREYVNSVKCMYSQKC